MLRLSAYILTFFFAIQATAASFDFLAAEDGSAQEFKKLMNSGNYAKAVTLWNTTLESTALGKSHSGQATYFFALYHSGYPLTALHMLFESTLPEQLPTPLQEIWKLELKNSSLVQKDIVRVRDSWKRFTTNETVRLKIKNKKDIDQAFHLADKASGDINLRARILWQIATLAPLIDRTDEALNALKLLRESGQTVIGQDMILSSTARIQYQKGEIDQALATYNEIPKSSSLWIESIEEKAWAYLRKNDNDRALGQTVTLLSPALAPLVGPESFYLANLMSLKVCDYPRIFKNSDTFKARHRQRLVDLTEIAQTGSAKNLNPAMDRIDAHGVSVEGAGPLVQVFPRAAFRDQRFVTLIEARRTMRSEIAKARAQGAPGEFGATIVRLEGKTEQLKKLALLRLRELARAELKEYQVNLNKMHVIEAEVMQRLAVDESLKGKRDKLNKAKDEGEVLVFPYDSDEVWFDELDNYKAQVKNCPSLKEASL